MADNLTNTKGAVDAFQAAGGWGGVVIGLAAMAMFFKDKLLNLGAATNGMDALTKALVDAQRERDALKVDLAARISLLDTIKQQLIDMERDLNKYKGALESLELIHEDFVGYTERLQAYNDRLRALIIHRLSPLDEECMQALDHQDGRPYKPRQHIVKTESQPCAT